ncbi:MAG: carbohydrate kinase family protein [Actinomycetota bacterium]|nr:carbohydrate kinase family protein [Actinomycetota bacterium]
MDAPKLIIVGTPSVDRIDIRGESHATVGGSGFITALAARLTGVSTGLIARVPSTLPDQIRAAFAPGGLDAGGLVRVDGSLPSFHISYDMSESATYLAIEPGKEDDVRATDVPRRWLAATWIHVGPLAASATLQLRFVEDLISRGYRGGLSAGTFSRAATSEPATVRKLFAAVDVAFLNRDEADLIFPKSMPSGTVVCVTTGRSGARRWDGSNWTEHPTTSVRAFDPTGAGDAFAGAYLGAMLSGDPDPVGEGLRVASAIIQGPGAAPLIDRLPRSATVDKDTSNPDPGSVVVDLDRTRTIASALTRAATHSALSFSGAPFPESGDPHAIDVLALATLHQYGFWAGSDHGYREPMWASIDGVRRKGSDFIWAAFTRAAIEDASTLDPDRLAAEPLLFDEICLDDEGHCPVPDVGSHRVLQQGYGEMIGQLGGIRSVIDDSSISPDPLATLLDILTGVPGYGEDPLAKKANLLGLILANRPERFLDLRGPTTIAPIIDYHIMRTTLRTGCVRIESEDLRSSLETRAWVEAGEESAIRIAARDAIDGLCTISGLGVGEVDGFLFNLGRTLCLESASPRCDACPLEAVCSRQIDLFQPIFRTTAY